MYLLQGRLSWQAFLRVMAGYPQGPFECSPLAPCPGSRRTRWVSLAWPVSLWLRADHKWPINLSLADTFSISGGGITDFEAISQRNELESGQTGGRG